jgi:murein endopeptidase
LEKVPFAVVLTLVALAMPHHPGAPSRAIGEPWDGQLVNGIELPAVGTGYMTWDPIYKRVGNRAWRRWGTDRLVYTIARVAAAYTQRHPGAPPILIGDLSRPGGGNFGKRFGGLGHASHQNGLDVDVYYPRKDGRLRRAFKPSQVDRRAAQELVDAFVKAGAQYVFVGPSLHLRGPRKIVTPLAHHDDHLHFRLRG